jgi:uncharacterized protein
MGERTSHEPGTFSWVELLTPDIDGGKSFYAGLFGWEWEDNPVGDGNFYSMSKIDGKTVTGGYSPPPDQGTPPNWLSYVTVEDADATAEKAKELGGMALAGPFDVLEAGRMAVLGDPTGAPFAIWQPKQHIGSQLVNVPGALTMNQLNTSDPEAATSFYSGLFGWRIEQLDTGGGPPYWSINRADGRLNGGMMPLPDGGEGMVSHWLAYFVSDDLDADTAKIGELGGSVLVPPTEIPSGRFAVAQDPQGAFFALFEGQLDD